MPASTVATRRRWGTWSCPRNGPWPEGPGVWGDAEPPPAENHLHSPPQAPHKPPLCHPGTGGAHGTGGLVGGHGTIPTSPGTGIFSGHALWPSPWPCSPQPGARGRDLPFRPSRPAEINIYCCSRAGRAVPTGVRGEAAPAAGRAAVIRHTSGWGHIPGASSTPGGNDPVGSTGRGGVPGSGAGSLHGDRARQQSWWHRGGSSSRAQSPPPLSLPSSAPPAHLRSWGVCTEGLVLPPQHSGVSQAGSTPNPPAPLLPLSWW